MSKKRKPRSKPQIQKINKRQSAGFIFDLYRQEAEIEDWEFPPVGIISLCEEAETLRIKDPLVFLALTEGPVDTEEEEQDLIELLVFYRNLAEQYPDEVLLHTEIAEIYLAMDEFDKHLQKVKENFERFQGNPAADMAYYNALLLLGKEDEKSFNWLIAAPESNIHDAYPDYDHFTTEEVIRYYSFRAIELVKKKDPDIDKVLLLLQLLDDNAYKRILSRIFALRRPLLHRLSGWGCLVAVVLLVVGVIWGLVALIRWLF
jgi:hypothetical protein